MKPDRMPLRAKCAQSEHLPGADAEKWVQSIFALFDKSASAAKSAGLVAPKRASRGFCRPLVLAVLTLFASAWAAAGLGGTASAAEAATGYRLLMFEHRGCIYCRIFNRDVAPIYRRSPEGQLAPLEHVHLGEPLPEGITLREPVFVTPTFVLIAPDGTEKDRLIGYPGEDFFWAYLERMFARAGISHEQGLSPTPAAPERGAKTP